MHIIQLLVFLFAVGTLQATQPIGDLVRVWNINGPLPFPIQTPSSIPFTPPTTPIEAINYITAQWDFNITPQTVPFDLNSPVTEIILTKPQHFVRVYAPASGGSPNGAWILRSEYARGLTPEQIKDQYALPTLPTHIVNVDLPASPDPVSGKDFALWTGIASPIEGFGNGGGVQNRIIADFNGTDYFPNYEYVIGIRNHPQLIGKYALSYLPMAGSGNLGKIAAYLDKFIPEAYSDLEKVYTDLDYLNWTDYGPDPIRNALNQISPTRYEAISFLMMRNSLLFSNAILERCFMLRQCPQACTWPQSNQILLQAVAEFLNIRGNNSHFESNADTVGGVANIDYQLSNECIFGIAVSGMENYLRWHHHGGNAHIATANAGLYASYFPYSEFLPSHFFVDGFIGGGYQWTKSERHIKFPEIDRHAHSHQHGGNAQVDLQTGFNYSLQNWIFTPLIRLSYFYIHQNSFKEHRAGSLNLHIRSFDGQILRAYLGTELTRGFLYECALIVPQVQLGWAHDSWLTGRRIGANLREVGGHFTVERLNIDRDSLLAGIKLGTLFSNGINSCLDYNVELGNHFTSHKVKFGLGWEF